MDNFFYAFQNANHSGIPLYILHAMLVQNIISFWGGTVPIIGMHAQHDFGMKRWWTLLMQTTSCLIEL